ncbi:MAG: peptidoglycan DD-metalloendopeptidase family protein [Planctomycetota bacterium]|jgi:murein DD-endopeptidase MepM/ murein hydrolase activator NlpD
MKKVLILALVVTVIAVVISSDNPLPASIDSAPEVKAAMAEALPVQTSTIIEKINLGEALYDIFSRNGLDIDDLYAIARASKGIYNISKLTPDRNVVLKVEDESRVHSLTYNIDSDNVLTITRTDRGYTAKRSRIPYETALVHISGTVRDNLVSSFDNLLLALDLSDIFAWDIDFNTDIRQGDSFKLVVEEQRLDGEFKKYGNIIAAEFINNGKTHSAYRFEQNGKADYFDSKGRSLRKSFLKAPLSFRRISSGFSNRRLHPVYKVYRPHQGVDYAASRGTPVSSVGDGTVLIAGYKRGNGNYIKIKHPNGYETYYLHLHRISKGIRKGKRVRQGQVIGTVGSTGHATGPHLDYRVKINGRFVNPLRLKLPPGNPVKRPLLAEFRSLMGRMNIRLATIEIPDPFHTAKNKKRS